MTFYYNFYNKMTKNRENFKFHNSWGRVSYARPYGENALFL